MGRFLKWLLQFSFMQGLIDLIIARAGFLIPGRHLFDSDDWMAIQHPNPEYPVHIVLIPKKPYRNWLSIDPGRAPEFTEFLKISQQIIRENNLETSGYRLIVNGGAYQTFPHLHIHLVSNGTIDDNAHDTDEISRT